MSRCKVAVVGDGVVADAVVAELARREDAEVVRRELRGARVVVLAGGQAPRELAVQAPDSVVVVAGGPDAVQACLTTTAFPRRRVLGTGGVAASRRRAAALARALGVSRRDVQLLDLGDEVLTAVAGVAHDDPPPAEGEAGPLDEAAALAEVVAAVLDDARRVLPCAVLLRGERGVEGTALAPCVVGAEGLEAIR